MENSILIRKIHMSCSLCDKIHNFTINYCIFKLDILVDLTNNCFIC